MGRSVIIYVLGLSTIACYALLNVNVAGTDAVDNYSVYYGRTVAHDIATSGANIGCCDLFIDPTYNTPYNNISFQGGRLDVNFIVAGNREYVRSIGQFSTGHDTFIDTVTALLQNQTLARYAWFTNFEANKGGQITSWSTGDSAFGPAHTNDKFNINGTPVFMKKATAFQSAVPAKNTALWAGGYEWGIKIPYPTTIAPFVTAATDPTNGRSVSSADAFLTMNPNGSIRLLVPSKGYDSTFVSATSFTANGAMAVVGGNLYVQGQVSGDFAVGAVSAAGVGGNVYITGDITYKNDPRTNPGSPDKLGLYAENDLQVTYDNSNPSAYQNRRVEVSIFSLKGDFEVQDAKKYSPRGTLTTYGAMMQYYRGEIGKVVGSTLQNGYFKKFQYDTRLATSPPKFFPSSGRYTLTAWREN